MHQSLPKSIEGYYQEQNLNINFIFSYLSQWLDLGNILKLI